MPLHVRPFPLFADSICQWTDYNPNHGFTNFDNFGATALNIFVMLTLDNWDALLLYPLSDSMGPGIPTTFFLLLVLFGSYFAMREWCHPYPRGCPRYNRPHCCPLTQSGLCD
jgi:hypothetical protein